MPQGALTSFTVGLCDAYRNFVGHALLIGHALNIYYQRIIL